MSVVLATCCLNEMEWLPLLYEQHRDWPGLVAWIFVESADRVFAETNPHLVTEEGLSVDGTTEYLEEMAKRDPLVRYVPLGFSDHEDPSLCKLPARRLTTDIAAEYCPEFFIVLDADEFYVKAHQKQIVDMMREVASYDSYVFPKREIWRPPSIQFDPLFEREVVGKFWSMNCCHWWRWDEGVGYKDCHISLQNKHGRYLNDRRKFFDRDAGAPYMLHLGYASEKQKRVAKIRYYEERGELYDDLRSEYTTCRSEWENWYPGSKLTKGEVCPYLGKIPEVFQ